MRWAPLALVLLVGCRPTPPAPADATPAPEATPTGDLDIRSPDGTVIISAADIVEYEWATHTMRWRPGVKNQVFQARLGELVHGSPFAVCVGGRPVYSGVFTSQFSSCSQKTVVICDFWREEGGRDSPDDAARLETGYPSEAFFEGADPRGNVSVRAALEASGKFR